MESRISNIIRHAFGDSPAHDAVEHTVVNSKSKHTAFLDV